MIITIMIIIIITMAIIIIIIIRSCLANKKLTGTSHH